MRRGRRKMPNDSAVSLTSLVSKRPHTLVSKVLLTSSNLLCPFSRISSVPRLYLTATPCRRSVWDRSAVTRVPRLEEEREKAASNSVLDGFRPEFVSRVPLASLWRRKREERVSPTLPSCPSSSSLSLISLLLSLFLMLFLPTSPADYLPVCLCAAPLLVFHLPASLEIFAASIVQDNGLTWFEEKGTIRDAHLYFNFLVFRGVILRPLPFLFSHRCIPTRNFLPDQQGNEEASSVHFYICVF